MCLLQVYGSDPKNWVTQYQEVLQAESEKGKKPEEDGKWLVMFEDLHIINISV